MKSCSICGKVMISGYDSPLYDRYLSGWSRHEFRLPNHAASGQMKRAMTEVVWCNFRTNCPKEAAPCNSSSLAVA
jgi:hypothetical protein